MRGWGPMTDHESKERKGSPFWWWFFCSVILAIVFLRAAQPPPMQLPPDVLLARESTPLPVREQEELQMDSLSRSSFITLGTAVVIGLTQ